MGRQAGACARRRGSRVRDRCGRGAAPGHAARAGRRRHRGRWRGHGDHHRELRAQCQPQSRPAQGSLRGRARSPCWDCARSSGCRASRGATSQTGTRTSMRASRRRSVVVAGLEEDPDSYEYAVTRRHLEILRQATRCARAAPARGSAQGPEHGAAASSRRHEFAAGYINFYVCNGAVIAPQFGDARADGNARSLLRELFPKRGRWCSWISMRLRRRVGGFIARRSSSRAEVAQATFGNRSSSLSSVIG